MHSFFLYFKNTLVVFGLYNPKIVFHLFLGGKIFFSPIQIIKSENVSIFKFYYPNTPYRRVHSLFFLIIKSKHPLYSCAKSSGENMFGLYNMNCISTKVESVCDMNK